MIRMKAIVDTYVIKKTLASGRKVYVTDSEGLPIEIHDKDEAIDRALKMSKHRPGMEFEVVPVGQSVWKS